MTFVACDPGPSLDWRHALDPGRVVILGEMHGTAEGPEFVAAAACTVLRDGRPVAVALEWPEGVDIASPATSAFLTATMQSGRLSVAMLRLARTVADRKSQGAPVELLFVDPADEARDVGMAARVRAWRDAHPEAVVLALVGNVHARRV